MSIRTCFVSASGQNAFFGELSGMLRSALEGADIATTDAVDHFPTLEDDLVYVFVPHEFMPLTHPHAHPNDDQLRRTVAVNTEQPGTPWFEEAVRTAARAGAVVDINRVGHRELRRRGIRARLIQLGYTQSWDFWGGDERSERPVDVTFLGGHTQRRAQALARCATVLSERRVAIHLVDNARPQAPDSPGFVAGESKWRQLAASKIVVNVHRDIGAYFEWQRILEAIVNGCVVLTEHSYGYEPLVPGEHFLSSELESMPFLLDLLLADEEQLASVRRASYEAVQKLLPLTAMAGVLKEAVEDVAREPVPAGAARHATSQLPSEPSTPPPAWTQVFEEPSETDMVRRGLKQVILAQRRLERRLDRLEREPGPDQVLTFGRPYSRRWPRVSVVVTLFNYAGEVGEALSSVALSTYEDFEIVVVDDCSTDESHSVARATLEHLPGVPAKLIKRGSNQGLPAARNLGVEHARGELIFMLDADNSIYPHALERLVSALDEDRDAAFAYGTLEAFDVRGPVGLLSWAEWDPQQLRYGNYIDAMSLLRRSALEQLGGYTTDHRLHGWEDFALWCEFAQRGLRGVHVAEIVARYRTGVRSMIGETNIDTSEAWSVLLEQYPFLRG